MYYWVEYPKLGKNLSEYRYIYLYRRLKYDELSIKNTCICQWFIISQSSILLTGVDNSFPKITLRHSNSMNCRVTSSFFPWNESHNHSKVFVYLFGGKINGVTSKCLSHCSFNSVSTNQPKIFYTSENINIHENYNIYTPCANRFLLIKKFTYHFKPKIFHVRHDMIYV